jgi:DNA-directed RNA polymerase subunit M/transcription elongation factor TFIIS
VHDLKHCGEKVHPTEFDDIDIYVCEGCKFKVDVRKLKIVDEVKSKKNSKDNLEIKLESNIAKPIKDN